MRNGTQIATGSWISGVPLAFDIRNLAPGTFNFTLIAHDGYGKSTRDSVFVTITTKRGAIDIISPTLTAIAILTIANCALLAVGFLYPILKKKKSRDFK